MSAYHWLIWQRGGGLEHCLLYYSLIVSSTWCSLNTHLKLMEEIGPGRLNFQGLHQRFFISTCWTFPPMLAGGFTYETAEMGYVMASELWHILKQGIFPLYDRRRHSAGIKISVLPPLCTWVYTLYATPSPHPLHPTFTILLCNPSSHTSGRQAASSL